MTVYRVPSGYGEAEFTEKKSRFIGRVWPVETEEEAIAHIKEMREKHWDASHNVYAYIVRETGTMRYSDDGEPQGTSGMPTLNVFRGEEIFNFCCVITRYFGGTLLGTGGLVRAYSHAAKLALEAAGISVMRLWGDVEIICTYTALERVKKEIAALDGILQNIEYGVDITIRACVPKERTGELTLRLIDITAGTVVVDVVGEAFRAVPASAAVQA